MKVRITEKLAKNRRVTMLKHSPCTVVGWLLHPEDRETTPESQRLLKHLPLCIYIKFEGAKWKVHPDMEPGVFPLKPVERQWTINEKTKAQAKRKGYALLPDFACTSHMIQGETLEAELAECGNVFDTPPLKDMLSAYVMLSRVKRATGLLLLRAFSLYLFRHGPPPGPHCLMKLLRSRLTPTESQGIYTQSDAKAEFDSLQARRREERDQRKQAGLLWHCFDCQKEYPPEVYCGRTNNKERMFQDCVAHGHWRTCSACQLAHTRTQKDATYSDAVRSCTKCAVFKTEHYFEEESESCMACDLEEKYIVIRCSKCAKFQYKADCSEGWIEDGHAELICTQCCPDKDKRSCFVCEKKWTKSHFPRSNYQESECIRCKACHKCSLCGQQKTASNLEPWVRPCRCFDCGRKAAIFRCDVQTCKQELTADHFDKQVLENAQKYGRLRVCKACAGNGYSPMDVVPYECQGDNKHYAGHLNFPGTSLKDWKRGKTKNLICSACIKNVTIEPGRSSKRKRGSEDLQVIACLLHCGSLGEPAQTHRPLPLDMHDREHQHNIYIECKRLHTEYKFNASLYVRC